MLERARSPLIQQRDLSLVRSLWDCLGEGREGAGLAALGVSSVKFKLLCTGFVRIACQSIVSWKKQQKMPCDVSRPISPSRAKVGLYICSGSQTLPRESTAGPKPGASE